jgi:hypothetical protein
MVYSLTRQSVSLVTRKAGVDGGGYVEAIFASSRIRADLFQVTNLGSAAGSID